MITITDKKKCCGCSACAQKCPNQCISMQLDADGFLYPQVDTSSCINCGLCEKVCPFIHSYDARIPIQTYAAINNDEQIRMESSSGGLFTLLAEQIINDGGVVFGARFDENWQVTIDYTETKEGLKAFRGSKYVQARTDLSYCNCESFLESGRKVMFTGTPCQISGLKHFLKTDYDNLLCVDIVCHGVPSPLVWKEYLKKINPTKKKISSIEFRNKEVSWRYYHFKISVYKSMDNTDCISLVDDVYNTNPYLNLFRYDLDLRPSCYKCRAKEFKSGSDITLGDFWGIEKSNMHDDDKGASVVIVNSRRGSIFLERLDFTGQEVDWQLIKENNPAIVVSANNDTNQTIFWDIFHRNGLIGSFSYLDSIRPSKMKKYIKQIMIIIKRKFI